MREAPVGLNTLLRTMWPDFIEVRFNELVARWEFIFTATTGKPVSVFYGWDRNPLTGEALEPDPISGLCPFRDLTVDAIAEIIKTGESTYLANRHDGARDWRDHMQKRMRQNRDLRNYKHKERGNMYADMMSEMNLKRPWVKHHVRQVKGQVVPKTNASNLHIQVVSR